MSTDINGTVEVCFQSARSTWNSVSSARRRQQSVAKHFQLETENASLRVSVRLAPFDTSVKT